MKLFKIEVHVRDDLDDDVLEEIYDEFSWMELLDLLKSVVPKHVAEKLIKAELED